MSSSSKLELYLVMIAHWVELDLKATEADVLAGPIRLLIAIVGRRVGEGEVGGACLPAGRRDRATDAWCPRRPARRTVMVVVVMR